MKLTSHAQAVILAASAAALFVIGALIPSCVSAAAPDRTRKAETRVSILDPDNIVVAYARKHPDPAVNGPFADKLASGEILIFLEKPQEHAMASFGPRGAKYALTIDPDRVKAEPTLEEYEDVLSILSHEHAHYRQYAEGQMTNYHPRTGEKMSETQCTLTILVEIDAHAKACRDVKAYGWTSRVARHECESTPASSAEHFLEVRLKRYPECKPVWEHFAGTAPAKPKSSYRRAPARTRAAKLDPPGRGPIYLPPP